MEVFGIMPLFTLPLSDPFFPPPHIPEDRVEKDCLSDLLCESVLSWVG